MFFLGRSSRKTYNGNPSLSKYFFSFLGRNVGFYSGWDGSVNTPRLGNKAKGRAYNDLLALTDN